MAAKELQHLWVSHEFKAERKLKGEMCFFLPSELLFIFWEGGGSDTLLDNCPLDLISQK